MDDDSPPPAKPTQVPSWLTLGFALGALFVLALPKRAAVEPQTRPAAEAPAKPAPPRPISTIEAVFADWGRYALWSDDTTEVALWNADTKGYSDYYEVLRFGDNFYFRTLPRLTRPILDHGVPDGAPLEYTCTVRQREEWLREVGAENMRALSEGVRQSLAPPTPLPQKP
jgi:hypothetical protein